MCKFSFETIKQYITVFLFYKIVKKFCCNLYQINSGLVSRRDSSKKNSSFNVLKCLTGGIGILLL